MSPVVVRASGGGVYEYGTRGGPRYAQTQGQAIQAAVKYARRRGMSVRVVA